MTHTKSLINKTGLILLLLIFVISACTTSQPEKKRGETFKQYETIVRWSQWDAAVDFISVDYLKDHPITRLEMDRLRLFKVTAYSVRSTGIFDDGMLAVQVVEIKMFNSRQGVERTILDEQEWRYNPDLQVWKLHSGLPDPTNRY